MISFERQAERWGGMAGGNPDRAGPVGTVGKGQRPYPQILGGAKDLARVRDVQSGQQTIGKTVEEYVPTLLIYEVYHREEVLAALWQMGVEPPLVDRWRC